MKIKLGNRTIEVRRLRVGEIIRKTDIWDLSDDLSTIYRKASECLGVGTRFKNLSPIYRPLKPSPKPAQKRVKAFRPTKAWAIVVEIKGREYIHIETTTRLRSRTLRAGGYAVNQRPAQVLITPLPLKPRRGK